MKEYSVCSSVANVPPHQIYPECTLPNGVVTVVYEADYVEQAKYYLAKNCTSKILSIGQDIKVQEMYVRDNNSKEIITFAPWEIPQSIIYGTAVDSDGKKYYLLSKPLAVEGKEHVYSCAATKATLSESAYSIHIFNVLLLKDPKNKVSPNEYQILHSEYNTNAILFDPEYFHFN